jgi:hypothetical protein
VVVTRFTKTKTHQNTTLLLGDELVKTFSTNHAECFMGSAEGDQALFDAGFI